MTCSNDVDIIDYQGSQPVNEKLSDQPNKIITFSPKLFSNLRNTPQNTETFKLTRSQDYFSIQESLDSQHQNEAHVEVSKCTYVYLHLIKSLKCYIVYTVPWFLFYTYL